MIEIYLDDNNCLVSDTYDEYLPSIREYHDPENDTVKMKKNKLHQWLIDNTFFKTKSEIKVYFQTKQDILNWLDTEMDIEHVSSYTASECSRFGPGIQLYRLLGDHCPKEMKLICETTMASEWYAVQYTGYLTSLKKLISDLKFDYTIHIPENEAP